MLLPVLVLMATRLQPEVATVPFRQPQLAVANGMVAMAFGGGSTIYFTSSSDHGNTFAAPVKVAETGALALGRHRGPRVAILKDALVISAVVGEKVSTGEHAHGLPESGNLAVWRSTDHGKSWKRTGMINDTPGAAREGLHAMTTDANGNLFAVWLDLRNKGTELYGARSSDGGVTWSKNTKVYASPEGTICQCCDPSISIDEQGRIYVMWRNVLDGARDLYLTSSADGTRFEPAKKLGTGTWKINACPMDGGGFIVNKGQVTSAWRRDGDVFMAEPDGEEKKLGSGKDVAIVQSAKGTFVAWTKDGGIQIHTPGSKEPVQVAAEGGFANLIALPDGSVLATWEAKASIETKRIN